MKITAATAAALALLTEALDEHGTDIAQSLHRLTLDAAAAVPSYLGLSIVVSQSNPPLTLTTLTAGAGAGAGDICTSLRMPVPGTGDGHDPIPVALILYARAPGAFVDLAADLAWLTRRPLTEVTLDENLVPAGPETTDQLQAMSHINQAVGVLIGRGYTPEQAHQRLDTQAANYRTDRHTAANHILAKISTRDDDEHFGIDQGPSD